MPIRHMTPPLTSARIQQFPISQAGGPPGLRVQASLNPRARRRRTAALGLLLGLILLPFTACHTPAFLSDDEVLPVGTTLEFWVDHDDGGWQKSNIHVLMLPREMTGREARLWAEGASGRDAGMNWTRYYAVATLPGTPPIKRALGHVHHPMMNPGPLPR